MLSSVLKYFLSAIKHCPICGGFLSLTNTICQNCNNKFFDTIDAKSAETKLPFPVYSLWTWGKLDYNISFLLYSLKGGGDSCLYQQIAKECMFHFFFVNKDAIYIPAASRTLDLDHSGCFAKALSKNSLGQLLNILIRGNKQKQKRLSKIERTKKNIFLSKDFDKNSLPDLKNKNIIFVDDVLTTGSTAMASYKALGCPKNFKVLVLAYRPKIKQIKNL